MLRTGSDGIHGVSRGFQTATAALRAARGCAMRRSRPGRVILRCPHGGLAPLSTIRALAAAGAVRAKGRGQLRPTPLRTGLGLWAAADSRRAHPGELAERAEHLNGSASV